MGASASSVEKTQQQKDIEYLGDRMPFGDSEILQVYRVYQKLQQKLHGERDVDSKSSFLKDVGALSASEGFRKPKKRSAEKGSPHSEYQMIDEEKQRAILLEERFYLLEAVERKILPPGFGNKLYQRCFLGASKISEYESSSKGAAEDVQRNDEYARIEKLEKFFEGLANGTRRDRKTVTRCLIKCCKQHPPPPSQDNEASNQQNPTNDFAD